MLAREGRDFIFFVQRSRLLLTPSGKWSSLEQFIRINWFISLLLDFRIEARIKLTSCTKSGEANMCVCVCILFFRALFVVQWQRVICVFDLYTCVSVTGHHIMNNTICCHQSLLICFLPWNANWISYDHYTINISKSQLMAYFKQVVFKVKKLPPSTTILL